MDRGNTKRKYLLTIAAALATFVACGVIDAIFSARHILLEATYLDDVLLAVLAATFVFALETYHDRENRRLRELADLVSQMNHHIRNALQVIAYANLGQSDSQAALGVKDSISRIEWVLREVLCESAIRMGVQSVPASLGSSENERIDSTATPPEKAVSSRASEQNSTSSQNSTDSRPWLQ